MSSVFHQLRALLTGAASQKGGPMNLLSALRLELRPMQAEPRQIRLVESPKAVLSSAEVAECTCPEFCERDHGNE